MTNESGQVRPNGHFRSLALAGLLLAFQIPLLAFQIPTADWTDWTGTASNPRLRARLVDAADNSQKHAAAVEVEVQHVWLHAPAPSSAYGVITAVLQYKVDSDPSVVTADPRLRFEQLPSGDHVITVTLLGVDDRPISGTARLSAHIP
jgi:hypothetical protein